MKAPDVNYFNIGPHLTLTFAVLMALILGGNGLLIWQFHIGSVQTDRLTGVSQQLIVVLRLQESLLSFHQRLDVLAQSKDSYRLATEAKQLRTTLLEQTQRTRTALTYLSSEVPVDPAFLPTLEAIEITLPSQLEAITALATSGDRAAVRLRLANEMKPLETQTSALVKSIDQEVSGELTQAVWNMRHVQRRIVLIVPTTAVFTFFIAAFFGWTITRRILELRFEERLAERTRIAQELHDTLLQGFLSASMQLHVVNDRLAVDSPVKPLLGRVLELMGQVIEEGRNAVRGLRSSKLSSPDLEQAFSQIRQEFPVQSEVEFRVIVEGTPRPLRPIILDEVYLIGHEALSNAFRHAHASEIEVELEYATSHLRVLIRDNGGGIDTQVLLSGREGHWGLSGMKERAERIGGKLRVLSRAVAGTEVELSVPGQIAFEFPSSDRRWSWLPRLHLREAREGEPKAERARQK
jgi:signal transduction histidine kinase